MKRLILLFYVLAFISCKAQQKDTVMITEKFDIGTFKANEEGGDYIYRTENNIKVWQSALGEYYQQQETPPSPELFQTIKRFYKSGSLQMMGKTFLNGGWKKGVWKYYREEGRLDKEIDYDAPYAFSWDKLLAYTKENDIDLQDVNTRIRRDENAEKPRWYIEWRKEFGRRETVTLDGKTGKVLDTGWYPHEDN